MPQIHFNGKTYNGLEEMPTDERAAYEQIMSIFTDADKNGVPDIFEGDIVKNILSTVTSQIVVHGHEIHGIENLPPEARLKVEQAMSKMSELGLVPQGLQAKMPQPDAARWTNTPIRPSAPLIAPEPVHSKVGTSRGFILIAILGVLVFCVAAAAIIFLVT